MQKGKEINKLDKFLHVLITVVFISILLVPNKFKAYSIVLLFTISVYRFVKFGSKGFNYKGLLSITSIYWVFSLSILFSNNLSEGIFRLTTMLPLLVVPSSFYLLKKSGFYLDKMFVKRIFMMFAFSNVLFFLITFIYFYNQEFNFTETIIHYSNLINVRLGLYALHPIYFSIYIGISLISLLYYFLNEFSFKKKFAYLLFMLILLIILSILMRKGPMIYLMLAVFLLGIKYMNYKSTIISILLITITSISVINYFPKYKDYNRFYELFEINNDTANTSTNIRLTIYKCSLEKILERPFGYGVGSTQENLDICYLNNSLDLSKKTYNSHNQYLSFLLTSGIVGFFIISYFITKKIYYLKNKKKYFAISVLVFILLNFITENVIERENGAILYGFIISLFTFYEYEEPKTSS